MVRDRLLWGDCPPWPQIGGRRDTADHVTLLEGMNEEGRREVLRCAQLVPSIPSYPNYVRQLKQEWRRRTILERLTAIGLEGNDADDMAEGLRTLLAEQDAIIAADRREVGQTLTEAYADFYNGLYENDVRYLSGYRDLDRLMGGLLPGSVFVLAARSGQGKTDFALALMLLYAAAGHKVLYYSMEMSKQQMMVRVAAQVSGIYNTRIRDKKLTKKEQAWISQAFGLIPRERSDPGLGGKAESRGHPGSHPDMEARDRVSRSSLPDEDAPAEKSGGRGGGNHAGAQGAGAGDRDGGGGAGADEPGGGAADEQATPALGFEGVGHHRGGRGLCDVPTSA